MKRIIYPILCGAICLSAQASPTKPEFVSALPLSSTKAEITWRPSTTTTGTIVNYNVYRIFNGATTPIATLNHNSVSYIDTGLSSGASYTYSVVSVDSEGNSSSIWNRRTVVIPAGPALKKNIYVDPLPAETGSGWDGNAGSAYSGAAGAGYGYASIEEALSAMVPGDSLILRGGVYVGGRNLPADKNGCSWLEGEHNTIASYPGEWAVLDGVNNLTSPSHILGFNGQLAFWKLERLEIRNGRNAIDNQAKGFYADGGPFIVRYCYIHDNISSQYHEIPAGIGGHNWSDSLLEFNIFKNNGYSGQFSDNNGDIRFFSDYAGREIYVNGFMDKGAGKHVIRNTIRYNLFEGSNIGIYYKSGQFFSGRNPDEGKGYSDAFMTYGDHIHHNIFRNNGLGIQATQDFIQVYNNIFDSCSNGVEVGEMAYDIYKSVVYNNTAIGCGISWIHTDYFRTASDPVQCLEPDYAAYGYNNIADGVTDSWQGCDLSVIRKDSFTDATFNGLRFDRNYFHAPVKDSRDPDGSRVFYFNKPGVSGGQVRYDLTALSWEFPGSIHWRRAEEDLTDPLYSSLYVTRGGHSLGGGKTIANGGLGGPHPYLDGLVLSSYIGATNPNDNAWVNGVLGLAVLDNLRNGPDGTPPWVEGAGSPPAIFTAWVAAHFTPAEQADTSISGPNADPDGAGVTNLQRYAFGLPARSAVANPVALGTADTTAGRVLTLTFPRRATASDLSYVVESSPDLVTWTPVLGRTYAPGAGPITAQDAVAISSGSRRFLRVRVSVSP